MKKKDKIPGPGSYTRSINPNDGDELLQDIVRAFKEEGKTGLPMYDLTDEEILKNIEANPANRLETYPEPTKPIVDPMEKAKARGRAMNRRAWIKDPDVGDEFKIKNRDYLNTPEATVKPLPKKPTKVNALKSIMGKLGKLGKFGGKLIPGVGVGMLASDAMAAADDIKGGASIKDTGLDFLEKQSPISMEDIQSIAEKPRKGIDRFMETATDAIDKKAMERAEEQADRSYTESQARKDRIEALRKSDNPLEDDYLAVKKLSSAARGKDLLEEGVSERDPEMEAMMRNINADPEAMLLRNPDRKREAAIKARRRLAEEMMKRNILPKMRD